MDEAVREGSGVAQAAGDAVFAVVRVVRAPRRRRRGCHGAQASITHVSDGHRGSGAVRRADWPAGCDVARADRRLRARG